jgi:GDPmannose 4,6-dehydratase
MFAIGTVVRNLYANKEGVGYLYFSDSLSLVRIVLQIQPDEIYNLGAQCHVAVSFESPKYTADTVGIGALHILEAIHSSK